MVHKKSEYMLQYRLLTKELRVQIWKDNIRFRSDRRDVNQAHHYWNFQLTDEECECDGEGNNDEKESDAGPLPPHREKHRYLVNLYPNKNCSEENKKCEKIIQAPREVAVQTPDWDAMVERLDEKGTAEDSYIVTSNQNEGGNSKKRSVQNTPSKSTSVMKKLPPSRQLLAHSAHIPTRTRQTLFSEGKKNFFAPFAYNVSETDMGKRKTFNVFAPEKEVHKPALVASKRKNAMIQNYLLKEQHASRGRTENQANVNHSSIWMSEYREKFGPLVGSISPIELNRSCLS